MKLNPALLLTLALGLLPLASLHAASASLEPARPALKQSKRPLDPALRPVEDVPGLPRVLLLGDSISIGYTLPVRELLQGKANVHRPPANCGETARGLQQLDAWLGTNKWEVIHFNFGLHDLKWLDAQGKYVSPDKGKQVAPLPLYEKNLAALVTRLQQTGARLIWCSTTPVPAASQGRVQGSEVEYNRVAAKVMQEKGVAVDDLGAYAAAHQAELQLPANVHFTKEGYRQLARRVAASIEQQLAK